MTCATGGATGIGGGVGAWWRNGDASGCFFALASGEGARIIGAMSVRTPIAPPARGSESPGGDLFARVVSELNDGLWKRNLKTDELWLSSRFMLALGFSANEYVPEKDLFDERLHAEDRVAMQVALQQAVRAVGQCTYEVRIRTKQDGYRWFRGRARAVPGADGKAAILIGAVFNVHEERAALEDMQHRQVRLTEALRDKELALRNTVRDAGERHTELEKIGHGRTRFILGMSHDLRTSLTNMMGMTELALRSTDPEARQRRLEVALDAGHALQATLDDVFEYAQLESGAVTLDESAFDLGELTAEASRAVNDQRAGSGGWVEYDFIGQHFTAVADRARLHEVMRRFFSHVAKTCPSSALRFTTRVTEVAGHRLAVRFEIGCSTGLPREEPEAGAMSPEEAAGQQSEEIWGEGQGLNLPIARRLVEALGGEVSLKRGAGGGTHFSVRLTVAQALDGTGELPEMAADRAPESIWVVGDSTSDANLLARRIRRLGFDPLVLDSHNALRSCEERNGAPYWAILTESRHGLPMSLPEIRRLLPHTRLTVSALNPDLLDVSGATSMAILHAPLSLRNLADRLILKRSQDADTRPRAGRRRHAIERVLLVEDNAVSQLIIADMLGQLGLKVLLATTGEEGVARCREHAPDVVLMDISLPGIDGLEAARQIQQHHRARHTRSCPIVALTASALDNNRDIWHKAGLDGFLAKPVTVEALAVEFRRLVQVTR